MIKIRLRRVGAKRQPYYRVVVADARSPRDGRFIETIGHYNPRTDPPTFQIKEDRAIYWLQRGAQPTDPVLRMFKQLGTLQKLERVKGGELLVDILAEEAVPPPVLEEEVEHPPVPEEVERPPAAEEEVEPVALAEVAIEELGLSARVLGVLAEAGIKTVQDVVSRLEEGREAMLAIRGLGERSLDEIEGTLRTQGFLE
jgi:small subunit ribosomal protein S16